MSDVQFETDIEKAPSRFAPQQQNELGQQKYGGGLTNWLVNKKIIKDESQAKVILIGIFILNVLLTLFVIYFFVV